MKTTARILLVILILLLPAALFADETSHDNKTQYFFTLGPMGMLNTDTSSAPSPIKFSLGFGISFPFAEWFSVAPSLNAFSDYYLWRSDGSDDRAYPAEVENRTAIVPSALIDVPAVFSLHTGNSSFALGLGAAFFARYAFLADGVPESDADDIDSINSYFYSDLRFLYPSVHLSYDCKLESGVQAGVIMKALVPLASLMEDRGLDSGIASIAFRMTFQ